MEVHPGIFVSNVATDEWPADPEVGGEMHVLVNGDGAYAGMSRFGDLADVGPWTLPARELHVGDMASLPKGATTTWHLTSPFKEIWFFGRAYGMAAQ
jgi:hypothetical protein